MIGVFLFISNSCALPLQRLRSTLLSFLQRLPHNETLKPHEGTLMSTALNLLKVENEENALHCIKIIIDGFRSHKVRFGEGFFSCMVDEISDGQFKNKIAKQIFFCNWF
jgi:hypothetical protein